VANGLEEICTFCAEARCEAGPNLFLEIGSGQVASSYILDETPHFVVMPCIGALVDNYVLVVSKRHLLSVGWVNEEEAEDLRRIVADWSERLKGTGNVTLFEHGSFDFRDKGGACYDHAHVHLLSTSADPAEFIERASKDVTLRCLKKNARTSLCKVGRDTWLAIRGERGPNFSGGTLRTGWGLTVEPGTGCFIQNQNGFGQ
jgi:diadenosine tetraphosphate (Ap4A) HIT family hydrolase